MMNLASARRTSKRLQRDGCDTCPNVILMRAGDELMDDGFPASAYAFAYTRDGSYSVWKRVNGQATGLQPRTPVPALNMYGEWNAFRVVAVGPELYFYVNGSLIWQGRNTRLISGRVETAMYRNREQDSDNLRVDMPRVTALPAWTDITDGVSPEQEVLNAEAAATADPLPWHGRPAVR